MATSTLTDFYATEPNNLCPACIIEWDEWLKGVSNPSEHRRIEKALRNPQSHDFRSAHVELFFHQHFAVQGAVIEWHPKLPDTSHRPEFLLHLNGDQFLFEARISDIEAIYREQQDFCRLLKPLIEELVKPLLQVQVLVRFNTEQNAPPLHVFPSLKAELVGFVEMGIAKFVNGFLAKMRLRHSIRWRGTEYTFTYVLSRLEGKNLQSQVVYGFGGTSGLTEKLYQNIEEKARRYGVPDKPFVIGIWSTNASQLIGEQGALYGMLCVALKRDSQRRVISSQVSNTNDGLFLAMEFGRLRYRNVSAVAFYDYLSKGIHHQHDVHVYHNPYATYPLDAAIFSDHCQFLPEDDDSGGGTMKWIPHHPD